MRVPFLSLLSLTILAFAASATDPPPRSVPVNQTLTVATVLEDDPVKIYVEQPGLVVAKLTTDSDVRHVFVTIRGVAPGVADVCIDCRSYIAWIRVTVVAEPPVAPTPPPKKPVVDPIPPGKTAPTSALLRAVPADPSASCVRVIRRGNNGLDTVGSGTVVVGWGGESLILTCAHVVDDGSRKILVEHQGKRYVAAFVKADVSKDLSLLRIPGVELPWVYIAKAEAAPHVGEELHQWGCCADRGLTAKVGKFQGRIDSLQFNRPNGAPIQSSTIDAQPGDSGSGVLNEDGRLVGVCCTKTNFGKGQGFAGLDVVKPFLGLSDKDCTGCTDCTCPPGDCAAGKCPAAAPTPQAKANAAPLECTT